MKAETNLKTGGLRGLFTAALACALLAAAPGSALAATAASAPSEGVDPSGYWTEERMRAAENLDPPAPAFPESGAPITRSAAADRGPVLTIPPLGGGDATPADVPSRAYESGEVADPAAKGNRTHGRVFFTVPGVGDAACSGTAIRSNRKSLILTAGHCVHGGGHEGDWFRNFVFVPAYDNGAAPYGGWQGIRLYSAPLWVEFADPTADIGMVMTASNRSGKLQNVVGARGIGFGLNPDRSYTAFGYPANPADGFDGQTERFCRSPYAGRDPDSGVFRGPRTISINCDMTQGASGGGWVNANGVVSSLTSYGYPELDDVVYGPYLGTLARQLYEATQIRCKGEVATIVGTPERDRIEGTSRQDVIVAAAGADKVLASPKADIVCGGPGADGIDGGSGGDELLGGGGDDSLDGGSGTDLCSGGDGKDKARACERTRGIR